MGNFDIRLLLAGIGLLLFGMNTFEEGLKVLAGKKMKYYLEKYTRNAFRSIMTGSFVTGILQSSSLVSLLLLGFVGAGMMALPNAIGAIIGANIGTTLDALYVSLLGFGEFSISAFAMPIISIGGILIITAGSNEKRLRWGKLLVGFGLLFIGIGFMKDSVEMLQQNINLEDYKNLSLRGFGLLGAIVTVVIQSSSATSVLTFTALASGLIDFPASVAIIMGANIGTTTTSLLASIGGKPIKRQLALAQVMQNIISGIIGVIFFYQYIQLTNLIVPIDSDPVFANAVLNTIFNVSTALLFAPFIAQFTALIKRMVPDQQSKSLHLFIDTLNNDTSLTTDILLTATEKDTKDLLVRTMQYNMVIWGLSFEQLKQKEFDIHTIDISKHHFDNELHKHNYDDNQIIANKLLAFIEKIKSDGNDNEYTHRRSVLEHAIVNCLGSMKHIKNIRHNIQALRNVPHGKLHELYKTLQRSIIMLYRQLITVVSDDFNTDDIVEIGEAIEKIKLLYAHNINFLASLGHESGDDELDTASLINITRELYNSSQKITKAVALIYLSRKEKDILDEI